jgi:hypothetical protein
MIARLLCLLFARHEKGEMLTHDGRSELCRCKWCGKPVWLEIGG